MKKKLALILISIDECFTTSGFSGGGHKVTKNLILQLVESDLFDIDIFCKKGKTWTSTVDGINSITVLNSKHFRKDLEEKLKQTHYDYILSSDILLPFANNLVHSNSSRYKSKNGKNFILRQILKVYNHRKIRIQEKNISKDKALFAVSESLKKDYVKNFKLDENKAFVCHPAVDVTEKAVEYPQHSELVIGAAANGGLNKGAPLLLYALHKLPKSCKVKARIILPKKKHSGFLKFLVKFLKLKHKVTFLPKQADMTDFYKSIDCYVLPSLNEAFGLVVTEAASNSRPSIVSSTTGVRELINDNVNGFVFDRTKHPVQNLVDKLEQVSNIYLYEHQRFVEISKQAYEISESLDWKKFGNTIIQNMVEEN